MIRRILKFYSNFWVVLFIVLPIGIFAFDQPLVNSTSGMENIIMCLKEIFALRGQSAYNHTWWFNSLILEMYIFFPLLFFGLRYACVPTMIFVFLLRSLTLHGIWMDMQIYLPIFAVGVLAAMYQDKINIYTKKVPLWGIYSVTIFCIIVPCLLLQIADGFHTSQYLYMILTIGLAMFIIISRNKLKTINRGVAFLGEHSANIYWIHTLIYLYWFPQFFYGMPSPILMFLALLGICLLISMAIEFCKKKSGYSNFVNYVMSKI